MVNPMSQQYIQEEKSLLSLKHLNDYIDPKSVPIFQKAPLIFSRYCICMKLLLWFPFTWLSIHNENVLCRFCLGGNILCLELVAFEFNKHETSIKSLQPMSLTIITAIPKLKPLFFSILQMGKPGLWVLVTLPRRNI